MVEYSIWALAYFVGSIPCGVLVARTQNINVKEHGSGNIGATNVTRILGKKAGILTLAGDCLKGYLPVALANQILGNQIDLAVTGFVAFSGHIFPIFLNFKGKICYGDYKTF